MSGGTGAVEALLGRLIGPGAAADLMAAAAGGPDGGLLLEGLPIEVDRPAPAAPPPGPPAEEDSPTLIR